MNIIMGDTLNLIGQLNQEYAQEIFSSAEKEGRIHTILEKDGRTPKYFFITLESLDMKRFKKPKTNKE